MINYYELLGINQGASEDEIRAKLKEKKRIWTQRQNAPKPEQQQEASNNLRMVPKIEATLLSSEKRAAYDKQLRTAPKEEAHIDTSKIESEDLIQEGWRLLSVSNVPDALMVATKATEIQGNNPDAWALLGYCKAQWGEIDDAIYEYKRAIKLRPNDASFYFDLGGIYENIEQWKDAMQQYQRATQIDPSKAVYRASMGSIFIKNEMYNEGINLLEKCVEEESDNEGYKYLLALAYNDSVVMAWKPAPNGSRICCTEESANRGIEYFEKALTLNVDDNELRSLIKSNLEVAKWAIDKHWSRSIIGTLKGGAGVAIGGLIIAAILESAANSAIGLLVGFGIVAAWIAIGFKPGWKINEIAYNQLG